MPSKTIETSASKLYYDKMAGKLVTDSSQDTDIVIAVSDKTRIFDQKESPDERIIYVSLLTGLSYDFDYRGGGHIKDINFVFGYDIDKKTIIFDELVPKYNRIYAISPGGELVALRRAPCNDCGIGESRKTFHIVDTVSRRVYDDLGVLYDFKFTGPRSFRYTTASYDCYDMDCVSPGIVKEGSF